MSMHMMTEAWKVELNSPIQKLVLMALAEKADNRRHARVSHQEIAKMCELPVNTVMVAIDGLTHKGFICNPYPVNDVYLVMMPEE